MIIHRISIHEGLERLLIEELFGIINKKVNSVEHQSILHDVEIVTNFLDPIKKNSIFFSVDK